MISSDAAKSSSTQRYARIIMTKSPANRRDHDRYHINCTNEELQLIQRQLPNRYCNPYSAPYLQRCSFTRATRCVDSSLWFHDHYKYDYQYDYNYDNEGADIDDNSLLDHHNMTMIKEIWIGINVGCNKGFDAINMGRVISNGQIRNMERSLWRKHMESQGTKTEVGCELLTQQYQPYIHNNVQEKSSSSNNGNTSPIIHRNDSDTASDENVIHMAWKQHVFCVEPIPLTIHALNYSANQLHLQSDQHMTITKAAIGRTDIPEGYPFPAYFHDNDNVDEHLKVNVGVENIGLDTGTDCRHQPHLCEYVPVMSLSHYYHTHVQSYIDTIIEQDSNQYHIQYKPIIKILSIDVEGYDYDVILGGSEMLEHYIVEYIEVEYNWMGSWAKQKLIDFIDISMKEYVCYFTGRNQLWRITGCFLPHYEYHTWSNIGCVHPIHNPSLYHRMEQLYHSTITNASIAFNETKEEIAAEQERQQKLQRSLELQNRNSQNNDQVSNSHNDDRIDNSIKCTNHELELIQKQLPAEFCNGNMPFQQRCSFTKATRCIDSSLWFHDHYKFDYEYQYDHNDIVGGNDDDNDTNNNRNVTIVKEIWIGINVGCNKGFDAINMGRVISNGQIRNMERSLWRKHMERQGAKTEVGCELLTQEYQPFVTTATSMNIPPKIRWNNTNLDDYGNQSMIRMAWKQHVFCIEPIPLTIHALNYSANQLQLQSDQYMTITKAAIGRTDIPEGYPFPAYFHDNDNVDEHLKINVGVEKIGLDTGTGCQDQPHRCEYVPVMSLNHYYQTNVQSYINTIIAQDQEYLSTKDQNNHRYQIQYKPIIKILSIDVEGYDYDVILGGMDVLKDTIVEYIEVEYNWMGSWEKQRLRDFIDISMKDYICYFSGRNQLWKITGCFLSYYEYHTWSNIACVHPIYNPVLYHRMEQLYNVTIYNTSVSY